MEYIILLYFYCKSSSFYKEMTKLVYETNLIFISKHLSKKYIQRTRLKITMFRLAYGTIIGFNM